MKPSKSPRHHHHFHRRRHTQRRVRYYYQTKGYFKALVADPKTKIRDTPPPWYWPFTKTQGKAVDITMPIEEGERYRLKEITFSVSA